MGQCGFPRTSRHGTQMGFECYVFDVMEQFLFQSQLVRMKGRPLI